MAKSNSIGGGYDPYKMGGYGGFPGGSGSFSSSSSGNFPGFPMNGFAFPSNPEFPMWGGGGSPAYAGSSATLGSNGGYGEAFVGGGDGLGQRIGETFDAPPGNSFGTFSSSASSSVTDENGNTKTRKQSTFGANNNGKVTFRTVSE